MPNRGPAATLECDISPHHLFLARIPNGLLSDLPILYYSTSNTLTYATHSIVVTFSMKLYAVVTPVSVAAKKSDWKRSYSAIRYVDVGSVAKSLLPWE